jgi:hypothetical protein
LHYIDEPIDTGKCDFSIEEGGDGPLCMADCECDGQRKRGTPLTQCCLTRRQRAGVWRKHFDWIGAQPLLVKHHFQKQRTYCTMTMVRTRGFELRGCGKPVELQLNDARLQDADRVAPDGSHCSLQMPGTARQSNNEATTRAGLCLPIAGFVVGPCVALNVAGIILAFGVWRLAFGFWS